MYANENEVIPAGKVKILIYRNILEIKSEQSWKLKHCGYQDQYFISMWDSAKERIKKKIKSVHSGYRDLAIGIKGIQFYSFQLSGFVTVI